MNPLYSPSCCSGNPWAWFCLFFGIAVSPLTASDISANLLQNPGFEDTNDWSANWKIENTAKNGESYFYHIDNENMGHVFMPPRTGKNAIEIYSSDRITRLSQKVELPSPGKYRVSAYGVIQGAGDDHQLRIGLGDQVHVLPAVSLAYRNYYADFDVKIAGPLEVSFVSSSLGMTLDDITLTKLPENGAPALPHLYFDLFPGSKQRSNGFQSYFVNQSQWVDFAVTCMDPSRLRHPKLNLYVPPSVKLSGLNEEMLARWKANATTDSTVHEEEASLNGIAYRKYSFYLPRFVEGDAEPLEFGGLWVEVPSGRKDHFLVEFEDQGERFPLQEITLIPVQPPSRQATPKKIRTVAYEVQDWRQDPAQSLQNIPRQFALMGLNTWSDYGLNGITTGPSAVAVREPEEKVREEASRHYGVTEFWPNFSELLQTDAGVDYGNVSAGCPDKDMFVTRADGTIDASFYNTRYAAHGGTAWANSALLAYQIALGRPHDLQLGYTNTGITTDALEFLRISYDPTTLKGFAARNKLNPDEVTIQSVQGPWKDLWLSYNIQLYAELVKTFAEGLHKIDPSAKVINTAGSFGPEGCGDRPLTEQSEWAQSADYTMPQWYGFMRSYSDEFYQQLLQGAQAKVYGKETGHADVIPLLDISMGYDLEDPLAVRFKIFDLLSASSAVKGIGYYQGYRAFTDAAFMAGLSQADTLLADVEDYYATGEKMEIGAIFIPEIKMPMITTTVRIHKLNRDGRLALLTIVTHCNKPLGEQGTLEISLPDLLGLPAASIREGDWVLIDRLSHIVVPFSSKVPVDTRSSHNLALLEIASAAWVAQHPGAIP
jgi:hypothetical protein